ncbi:hypothetical protein V6N13_078504 [Hibiscus sabdariffa]
MEGKVFHSQLQYDSVMDFHIYEIRLLSKHSVWGLKFYVLILVSKWVFSCFTVVYIVLLSNSGSDRMQLYGPQNRRRFLPKISLRPDPTRITNRSSLRLLGPCSNPGF